MANQVGFTNNYDYIMQLHSDYQHILQDVENNPSNSDTVNSQYTELECFPGSYFFVRRAAERGFTGLIEKFLEYGFPINKPLDVWGNTMLHVAAEYGFSDTIRLLISNGADVHARTREWGNQRPKFTPLHYAIYGAKGKEFPQLIQYKHVVALLLDCDSDIAAQDGDNKTPLHYAAEYGLNGIVDDLINYKDETKTRILINMQDNDDKTPLQYAREGNHHSVVSLLLKKIKEC